ncbi:MAG: hypothetical protein HKN35_15975 [Woeseia sp.]|nr:hypothetical protein [Woeseia sp.]
MPMIIESSQEAATNADVLNGTRLATAPHDGVLTLYLQASDNDATNNYTATVQLPGGDNPISNVRVPCGNTSGLAGVLDDRTAMITEHAIQQGGQVLLSVTETGDAELTWRAVFRYR